MRRIIVTVGGLTVASLFGGCTPAYYDTRPRAVYVAPAYGPTYGYRERGEGRERHEEHEHRDDHEHHDHE
jgi:hypothetical protein